MTAAKIFLWQFVLRFIKHGDA